MPCLVTFVCSVVGPISQAQRGAAETAVRHEIGREGFRLPTLLQAVRKAERRFISETDQPSALKTTKLYKRPQTTSPLAARRAQPAVFAVDPRSVDDGEHQQRRKQQKTVSAFSLRGVPAPAPWPAPLIDIGPPPNSRQSWVRLFWQTPELHGCSLRLSLSLFFFLCSFSFIHRPLFLPVCLIASTDQPPPSAP